VEVSVVRVEVVLVDAAWVLTVKLEGTLSSTVVGELKLERSTTLRLRTKLPVPSVALAPVVAPPSPLVV
jgi:hypothetical protein